MPELVAENVVSGKPWWHGFANFVADAERRRAVFRYEREGLSMMVQNTETLPESPERVFVQACHEAWRRRLGQLGDRARRENTSFTDLARREFDKLRVTFSRCKNAAAIREALTDFWARAGNSLPPLRESWPSVLQLLEDRNWRKAKDLALLALASYKPASRDEEEALDAATPETET